jgi:hypothetical protein
MAPRHLLTPKLRDMYDQSLAECERHADRLAEVERYCMFVGYPRSGHTIVASMLAAHPDAAIAIELDALRFVAAGFSREQIFHLLLERSLRQSRQTSYEYDYTVPGQWQGRVRRLRVIGDKEAGMSNLRLRWEPDLLDRVRAIVCVPLRVIHVVRHPLDNIATMLTRGDADHLEQAIGTYFRFAANARGVMGRLGPGEGLEIHQEDLIASPGQMLARLCAFLEIDAEASYVEACSSIVMEKLRLTRASIDWPSSLVDRVASMARDIEFLARYDYII